MGWQDRRKKIIVKLHWNCWAIERHTSNGEKRQMKEMTLKKTIDIVPMTNVWHFFAEYLFLFLFFEKS